MSAGNDRIVTNGPPELPEPKVGHRDAGVTLLPFGPRVYLIVSHAGSLVGVEATRHQAVAACEQLHDCNDYELRYIPVGMVPIRDLRNNYDQPSHEETPQVLQHLSDAPPRQTEGVPELQGETRMTGTHAPEETDNGQ